MIKFSFVQAHEIAEFIARNVKRHYDEMEDDNAHGAPNVDWEYYLSASHNGQCYAAVAHDNNEIVGYSVYAVSNNPRHKHVIEAFNQGLFIEKPHRKIWSEFLDYAENALKGMGVQEVSYMVNNPKIGRILSMRGLKRTYEVWTT